MQMSKFEIKTGIYNSNTQNNSLTRAGSNQRGAAAEGIPLKAQKPKTNVNSPSRLKKSSPNSFIVPQNSMPRAGQMLNKN
jgi:hypothetical protein